MPPCVCGVRQQAGALIEIQDLRDLKYSAIVGGSEISIDSRIPNRNERVTSELGIDVPDEAAKIPPDVLKLQREVSRDLAFGSGGPLIDVRLNDVLGDEDVLGRGLAIDHVADLTVRDLVTLLFFPVMGAATKAAKPVASQPCSLTFIPRAGDKITSDGGSYIDATLPNGDSRVSCQVSGGNTDSIKLVLSAPKRGTPRNLSVKYNPDPNAPAVTFTDGSYIIIQHATQIAVGTSQLAGAHFRFNGSWSSTGVC